MKKLLFMVLAIAVFAGCSKEESIVLSEGDKITRSINPSNTPLMNYLKGSIWEEERTFIYSEPDGKGEEKAVFDAEILSTTQNDWQPYEFLTFSDEQFIKYIPITKEVRTYHYYDFDIVENQNDTFIFTRNNEEYYLKVLAYGDDKIWIETNCYDIDKNYQKKYGRADSYPYVRILYYRLPLTSYPINEGFKSEEEITPYEIECPIKLPDNFFEVAEGTPIWRQEVGYQLVYDKDNLLCSNSNLVINKGLGENKYDNNDASRNLYKFVDGVLYRIHYYEDPRPSELITYHYLKIEKCENPNNYILGMTNDNQIILSESDYNALIETPYYKNTKEYNTITCYYLSEGTDTDIEMLKHLYESSDVQKVYSNF